MNETEKDKVKRFINDPIASGAVYNLLLESFLKERKGQDVQVLAASRLSIDFFKEGWRELINFKTSEDKENKTRSQVGV